MAGSGSGSALVANLKSAAQNVEILECKNVELKKELEQMKKENELVQGKFEIGVSERLKLQKEFDEFKVLNSQLREERDEMSNRLVENEDYYHKEMIKLEKKICLWKKLKRLAFRLKDERDKLSKRLKENENDHREIIELKRKNFELELECEKLKAELDADVYQKRVKELEGRLLIKNF